MTQDRIIAANPGGHRPVTALAFGLLLLSRF